MKNNSTTYIGQLKRALKIAALEAYADHLQEGLADDGKFTEIPEMSEWVTDKVDKWIAEAELS